MNPNQTEADTGPARPIASPKRISLEKYEKTSEAVLEDEDREQPTAIVGRNGKVIMTVGMNGRKFFPNPDPDPLDEIGER